MSLLRRNFRSNLSLCFAFCFFSGLRLFGATVEVGTCSTFTQYTTIQAAVNASSPGDMIDVCPNTYPEQVTINKSLTLQGLQIAMNKESLSIVTAPSGGMVANATTLGGTPVAAQMYIAPGANVTISNLTVDGQGNGINSGCGTEVMGIYFQNASGTVTQSAVLNETLPAGLTGCQDGEGIFVESGSGGMSNVNVNNTIVENYQKNGITWNSVGTTLTVTNDTIVGQGSTTGAAENGVQIGFGAAGTITSNTVSDDVWGPDTHSDPGDAAAGILVFASKFVTIRSNQVTNTQFGIAVVSDATFGKANGATITMNTVNATHIFDAIDVCSNNNTVTSNTINGADESGIHLDDSCGSSGNNNNATGNTISLSCAGILRGPLATGNNVSATFYNVGARTVAGDTCFVAPSVPGQAGSSIKSTAKTGRPQFKPSRP